MSGFAVERFQPVTRPKLLTFNGPIHLCPSVEEWLPDLDKVTRKALEVVMMAGSVANSASTVLADLLFGKTAFAGDTSLYFAAYTAAIDSSFTGATANEAAYTSYARTVTTNGTSVYAAGSGTTAGYTKTFPSNALLSMPTSTGSSATLTYVGGLNGNAGSSADKGRWWASVTSVAIGVGDTPQIPQNGISVVFGA